ncbi:MAG: hypothetical protein EBU75_01995 [Betaproteobacteria bacterium]|nr:hypothetical protein [Betaproteobacteria bacterium]
MSETSHGQRWLGSRLTRPQLIKPALVIGVDTIWSWMAGVVGTPWLVTLLAVPLPRATAYIDSQLEPVLMVSYWLSLAAQVSWLGWISKRSSLAKARQRWWMLMTLVLLGSIAMQSQIARLGPNDVPASTHLLLAAMEVTTLLAAFWLPCVLLTPLPQRQAIPLSQWVPGSEVRS